jgi:hypothetical protein
MMWNFIETIYDRCDGRPDLERTWQPIIEVEGVNHLEWLVSAQNRAKFKDKFISFLGRGGFVRFCRSDALNSALRMALEDLEPIR